MRFDDEKKKKEKRNVHFFAKKKLQFHPLGFVAYHFSVICISFSWWAPHTDSSTQPRQWSRARLFVSLSFFLFLFLNYIKI